jgi:nucleoside-diphosphate-sugar epimerase
MKVLVTGGAGYVGTSLMPLLLQEGYTVRVVDNLIMGGIGLLPFFAHKNFEFQRGDIRDKSVMSKALEHVDFVIHLAGIVGYPACRKFPEMSREINVDATRQLVELAGKDLPILFASTGSGYGQLIGDLCTETSPLNPVSDYGKQKVEGEKILQERGNHVTYRYATAFGVSPRMRLDLLVNDFTFRAVKDRSLIVYEKKFMRTFIHVRDMARSFIFAIKNYDKMKNEVYNVGDSRQNLSKEDVCLMIRKQFDYYLHFAEVGKDVDQRNYMVSYEKIEKLGFRCSVTVEEGIDELIKAAQVIDVSNPFANV